MISNLVRRELAGEFVDRNNYVADTCNFNEGFSSSEAYLMKAQGL